MGLKEQVEGDLKEAMRSGDSLRRDTLRMALAALKNRAIELGGTKIVLDADQAVAVIKAAVKTRLESAEQYQAAGRTDLEQRERAEITVLEGYLPKELSEEQTRKAVQQAIAETGASSKADLGKVIKAVMAAHKGQVNGKLVQTLIAEALG